MPCSISYQNATGSSRSVLYSLLSSTVVATSEPRQDICSLDSAVQFFRRQVIADSTHKIYQSALKCFRHFCSQYDIVSPFPVSEAILCYFAMAMANNNLVSQTVKTHYQLSDLCGYPWVSQSRDFSISAECILSRASSALIPKWLPLAPYRPC